MFFEFGYWELWSQGSVIEPQGTVAGGSEDMEGMSLGMSYVVEGVLRRVPGNG